MWFELQTLSWLVYCIYHVLFAPMWHWTSSFLFGFWARLSHSCLIRIMHKRPQYDLRFRHWRILTVICNYWLQYRPMSQALTIRLLLGYVANSTDTAHHVYSNLTGLARQQTLAILTRTHTQNERGREMGRRVQIIAVIWHPRSFASILCLYNGVWRFYRLLNL